MTFDPARLVVLEDVYRTFSIELKTTLKKILTKLVVSSIVCKEYRFGPSKTFSLPHLIIIRL